jgi:hypothetical protein
MDMNTEDWRSTDLLVDDAFLEKMARAVDKVRDRLHRATEALEDAKIPYAVADDFAVACWVGRLDGSAVRNTPDVGILVRPSDLETAAAALSTVGFVQSSVNGINRFLGGPSANARDAVNILFAGEKVRAHDLRPSPDGTESVAGPVFRILDLEPLNVM